MSDVGERQYQLHQNGNVPLARTQQELTALQRQFLMYGSKHYGPDEDEVPDQNDVQANPSTGSGVGGRSTSF